MKMCNTIDWVFKWIALISAGMSVIIAPCAHMAWVCVVLWIIVNMIQKMYIAHLEKDNDDLRKENLSLYDRLTNIKENQ